MTAATAAAAWMDRLSDRIGSLIPGGYRLPPRHPIKVSVVMGLLGSLSAWSAVGLAAARWPVGLPHLNEEFVSGAVFGVVVILPLALWLSQRWWRAGASVFIGVHLFAVALPLAELHEFQMTLKYPFEASTVMLRHTIFFFAGIASVMCLVIVGSSRQRNHVASAVLCGIIFVGALFVQTSLRIWMGHHLQEILPGRKMNWLVISSVDALDHGILHVGLALTLGVAVWDTIPRPKFEPNASANPEETVP